VGSERDEKSGETDEAIERALARLSVGLDALGVAAALRRELSPENARRAAELLHLRERAKGRFPSGKLRFMTRKGLEQATRESVAAERARRFAELAPGACVHDVTCGLGSDALALSLAGMRVLASDTDFETARCAHANLRASPNPNCVFVGDALRAPLRNSLLFVDPDRRAGAERSLNPRDWSPSADELAPLLGRAVGACVRLPAGFDIERCPIAWIEGRDHSWQWVSAEGELSEVNLWLGTLASKRAGEREVVSIPRQGPLRRWCARPCSVVSSTPEEVSEISWLADPDPAVVRSGLLGALAKELGAAPLAPECAYLGAPHAPNSDLVNVWRVLAQASADPKAVRRMLTEHGIGPIQVLKRGHPERSEVLAQRFAGRGDRRGTVVVARLAQGHRAFLVERADPGPRTAQPGGGEPLGWAPERSGRGGVGDEGFEPPTSSV
jgi:hypothetical protein